MILSNVQLDYPSFLAGFLETSGTASGIPTLVTLDCSLPDGLPKAIQAPKCPATVPAGNAMVSQCPPLYIGWTLWGYCSSAVDIGGTLWGYCGISVSIGGTLLGYCSSAVDIGGTLWGYCGIGVSIGGTLWGYCSSAVDIGGTLWRYCSTAVYICGTLWGYCNGHTGVTKPGQCPDNVHAYTNVLAVSSQCPDKVHAYTAVSLRCPHNVLTRSTPTLQYPCGVLIVWPSVSQSLGNVPADAAISLPFPAMSPGQQ
eukprot:366016-Chlamydomonas_euryale.AAC.3